VITDSKRTSPDVSVVIPVRENAAELRRLLQALDEQTVSRERFEVLIGNDGSDDATIERLTTTDGRVRVLSGPPLNQWIARNRAAKAASGSVLAFIDADCVPDPRWLEAGLEALRTCDVAAGQLELSVSRASTVWTAVAAETLFDQRQAVQAGWASAGNFFIHRDLFERIGRFDESIPYGGDVDLGRRLRAAGARVEFASGAVVSHPTWDDGALVMLKLWRRNRWRGTRRARRGLPPELRFVPLLGPFVERRQRGLSLGLDRAALKRRGLSPTFAQRLLAIPVIYLLVPTVRTAAGLYGWLAGRVA
jgi:GT2 family glycosyltransferase